MTVPHGEVVVMVGCRADFPGAIGVDAPVLGGVEEVSNCVRPVGAGRDGYLEGVREMCEYGTYLMWRWEMNDDPTVAPLCEVNAMELFGPAGGANPLSDGGGGAPGAALGAYPALEGEGGGGRRGCGEDPEETSPLGRCPAEHPELTGMQAVVVVGGAVPGWWGGESEELRDDVWWEPLTRLARPVPGQVPPGEEAAVLEGDQGSTLLPRVEEEGEGDI